MLSVGSELNCFFLVNMSYKILELIDLSLSNLIYTETKRENLSLVYQLAMNFLVLIRTLVTESKTY